MAESAYLPGLATATSPVLTHPRHSVLVRITHWVNTLAFFGLLISGIAILLAHPRLYWGETGGIGTPSLIDLPLPLVLVGQSGWGRYLHFLSAWVCVLNGLLYLLSGLIAKRFRRPWTYNLLQRFTYVIVVSMLFPVTIWTGLAMSPAIISVFPSLVIVLGGQQSARTIHFFAAGLLVIFLLIHVSMVYRAGFRKSLRAMIAGRL